MWFLLKNGNGFQSRTYLKKEKDTSELFNWANVLVFGNWQKSS